MAVALTCASNWGRRQGTCMGRCTHAQSYSLSPHATRPPEREHSHECMAAPVIVLAITHAVSNGHALCPPYLALAAQAPNCHIAAALPAVVLHWFAPPPCINQCPTPAPHKGPRARPSCSTSHASLLPIRHAPNTPGPHDNGLDAALHHPVMKVAHRSINLRLTLLAV